MKPTHIILTRADGSRIELTVDEARDLLRQLGALFCPQPTYAPACPAPGPAVWPGNPISPTWVGPLTSDPLPPPWTITCETRPQ